MKLVDRSVVRSLACIALVSLGAGCAGKSPAVVEAETQAKLESAVEEGTDIKDSETLSAAIDAGYDIVAYRNGERVYCKKEPAFGTRVRERITCLTEAEARTLRQDTRDWMDEATRRQIPKQGG